VRELVWTPSLTGAVHVHPRRVSITIRSLPGRPFHVRTHLTCASSVWEVRVSSTLLGRIFCATGRSTRLFRPLSYLQCSTPSVQYYLYLYLIIKIKVFPWFDLIWCVVKTTPEVDVKLPTMPPVSCTGWLMRRTFLPSAVILCVCTSH
jgi:hypothetical protein